MRVIDSAISLAKKRNDGLTIFWKQNSDLNAPFDDLFDPIFLHSKRVEVINFLNAEYDVDIYKSYFRGIRLFFKPLNIDSNHLSKNKISHFYNEIYQDFIKKGDSNKKNHIKIETFWDMYKSKNLYINTFNRFHGSLFSDYNHFAPNQHINNLVLSISEKFSNYMIGVHIRRSDNIESIQFSTREKFEVELEKKLTLNRSSKIFLATDSEEEKIYFINRFSDRVITSDSKFDRNSKLSIQDALIDLLCLSKCNELIGSYYSSFTEVAVLYNRLKDYKIMM
jgi:hypothetical protein